MSFKVEIDRFRDLRAALSTIGSSEARRLHLRKEVEDFGFRFLGMLRQAAPTGERWTEPDYTFPVSTGQGNQRMASIREWRPVNRPSIRQFGTTLRSSWVNPVITSERFGTSVLIGTSTRQARILLQGSPPHEIPKYAFRKPFVSFWWHRQSKSVFAAKVSHPGFPPRNFVERTFLFKGRTMAVASLNQAMNNMKRPLVEFFRS